MRYSTKVAAEPSDTVWPSRPKRLSTAGIDVLATGGFLDIATGDGEGACVGKRARVREGGRVGEGAGNTDGGDAAGGDAAGGGDGGGDSGGGDRGGGDGGGGATGTLVAGSGVTPADGVDAGLSPTALVATTVKA